ncbi:MAG: TonB-dependent receptor [Pyrinomonadaceae bacterium]|nr:TonB-dependent receptor [Pyrinomonadaceae bacterium]
MKRYLCERIIGLVMMSLLAAGMLAAQETTGQIEGTVVDGTKAVIPGATVTVTHVATNTIYTATTSSGGKFAVPNARLGMYTVAIEAASFRRTVVRDVLVEVGKTASLKITMQVGGIQEEVVVDASEAQELVNTTNAELSTVVDERRVQELPLNGRNASHLALNEAGVYHERSPDGQGNKLIVHGQRHSSVNISLDGIDTQDNLIRTSTIMLDQPLLPLAAENVQEFKVVTGISSAEYSRGGVQISAVTRSGGNEFHGSVFWFHRNDIFNANDFFNNGAGVERPKLIRNQFGGRIGGPIFKDKTFFFFGYEQQRQSRGIAVNRTVYTAEARQGIFRYLDNVLTTPENVAANPGLIRTVNLLECSANVQALNGQFCVDDRFDMANPTSLDPFIAGTVFPSIPLPNNFVLGDGLNTGGFRFNAASLLYQHLPSFRLDHKFNDNHSFFGTINYTDREIDGDFINNREPRFPDLGPLGARLTHSKGFGAGLRSTFSPTIFNEFRFGFLGGENAFQRKQPYGTSYTINLNTVTDPYEPGGGDSVRDNVTVHFRDTLTWIRGDHQLKFGGEFRHRWVDNYSFFATSPEFLMDDNAFSPGFSESDLERLATGNTSGDIESADIERARDLMNNLVGAISTVEIRYNATDINSGFVPGAPERKKYRVREYDFFVQDNWNLKPNLTLNLGVRWEYAGVPIETQGLLLLPDGGEDSVFGVSGPDGYFNPGVFNGTPCPTLGMLPLAPTSANVTALFDACTVKYSPGGANNGRPFWDNDYNNFAPVIGVAWNPFKDGKTSIRAGFRISYAQNNFNIVDGNADDNEGLTVNQTCIPDDGTCVTNTLFLRDLGANLPVPAVPAFNLPASRSILDSTTQDHRSFTSNLGTPTYTEWTVGFQREIIPDLAVEVRYVGNRGDNLRRVEDYNEYNINAFDPISGMTYLDSFLLAQQNLACNRANGEERWDTRGHACSVANPLLMDLIAADPSRLRSGANRLQPLDRNSPGDFLDELLIDRTSRPGPGAGRIRGGAFWGAVLQGRFPLNFFSANPFLASSRRLTNTSFSTYHAMELEVRRRFARGFTMQANYTFGKALSDFDGDNSILTNDTRASSVRNQRYSVRQIMPRHLFKANWIYELPFGNGKAFDTENRVLRTLLSGWQFGGIVNWRSGRPISIVSGVGTNHRSSISDDNTVNLSQPLSASQLRDLTGRQDIAGGTFWLDPCLSFNTGTACTNADAIQGLFQLPRSGELGELTQTPIYGPRRFRFDFNLSKRTKLTEDMNMEFRWEVFNAFNHVNFGLPSTNIFSTSFGQTTTTITNPRLMQFALKLNF